MSAGETVGSFSGYAAASYDDVACALGCGRHGSAEHFVRDLRMPGVLVRVEVDRHPWFVCAPCREASGIPICCLRCGCETHVTVGAGMRCVRCGQLS
jgi:hypothetical protein